jgi:hypothetical protein
MGQDISYRITGIARIEKIPATEGSNGGRRVSDEVRSLKNSCLGERLATWCDLTKSTADQNSPSSGAP